MESRTYNMRFRNVCTDFAWDKRCSSVCFWYKIPAANKSVNLLAGSSQAKSSFPKDFLELCTVSSQQVLNAAERYVPGQC